MKGGKEELGSTNTGLKVPLLKETQNETTDSQYPSKAKQIGMVTVVLSLQLLSLAADTALFPFFPATAIEKGLSGIEIGIVFSSFDFAKFIASPICGSLLAKWHPKSMLTVGNIMTALACVVFGLLKWEANGTIFLVLCILTRCAAGVGSAMLCVAAASLLMKSTSFEPSTIAAVIEMVVGLGYSVGPAVGSMLFEAAGYLGMFCIIGSLMLTFVPVFVLVLPRVVDAEPEKLKRFFSLLAIPGCCLIFIHCFLTKVNGSGRSTGIAEFMIETFGISSTMVGVTFGGWALVYTVSSAIAAKFYNKKYTYHLMLMSWICCTVFGLLVGPSKIFDFLFHGEKYLWLTIGSTAAIYVVAAYMFITPFQAALDLAIVNGHKEDSLHTYGLINGLVNCGWSLGNTAGPVISGAIIDAFDFPTAQEWLSFANIILILLIVSYLVYMKVTKQPLAPSPDTTTEVSTDEDLENY